MSATYKTRLASWLAPSPRVGGTRPSQGLTRKAADHSLGEGDKELAACAKTVRDTIAACTALRELAAADSPHVKDLAKVVSGICGDCEAECKKHEKHSVCKEDTESNP